MIWPLILISYASLLVYGISDNVRGPLFPEILQHFNVNDSMGSMMFALSSISSFAASHLTRYLLRRHSRKYVLQLSSLALTFALLGLAFSPNFIVFLLCSVAFGLSIGILGIIPNIIVPLASSPEKKQQLLSGLHAMYGVASFIAPLLVAALGSTFGSWRWSMGLVALAPLGLWVYSLHPSHVPHHRKIVQSPEEIKKKASGHLYPQVFLAFMVSFDVAAEIMISSRLALYMKRVWNYDLEQSSLYVTGFFLCLLAGRLLFTVVKFRKSLQFQLSGSVVFTMLMILLGVYAHPAFLMVSGLGIAPFYPLAIAWISTEFPEDLDSAVSHMIAADSIVLVLMHLSAGSLTDNFGIKTAILSGLVYLSLAFLMINSYGRLFKRQSSF